MSESEETSINLRTCIIQSHEHCSRLAGLALALVLITACTATSGLADPLAAGWRGTPVCERLHEDSTQRILRCTFPPGVGHERHFHEPHFGYTVVGGRMQMTDEAGSASLTCLLTVVSRVMALTGTKCSTSVTRRQYS